MVKNNFEIDVKVKCMEEDISAYVNRVIKKKEGVLNNTFIRIMEALGYDIELTYVKREESR